jgi:hypothetical protein
MKVARALWPICASVVNVQINPLAAQFNFNLLSSVFPVFLLNSLYAPRFGTSGDTRTLAACALLRRMLRKAEGNTQADMKTLEMCTQFLTSHIKACLQQH